MGEKKIKGRKRHILVDTNGLLIEAVVHQANISDNRGAEILVKKVPRGKYPRLEKILGDMGYRGEQLRLIIKFELGVELEIVKRPTKTTMCETVISDKIDNQLELFEQELKIEEKINETLSEEDEKRGFKIQPMRWIVERTLSWLDWGRRLSKDYERLLESSRAFVFIGMIGLGVRRLTEGCYSWG